jgi:hypothetical protein
MRNTINIAAVCLFIASLWLAAASSHAARPLITDDAGIAERGTCELELWLERPRDASELWVMPACNFTGNIEWTLGGSVERANGETGTGEVEFSGKTLFRNMEPNDWGFGLAAGVIHDPNAEQNRQEYFAHLPFSHSFMDDRFLAHANLGWLRERETHDDLLTWALASEYAITDRTRVVGEIFGEDDERPHFQLGVAHWLSPDRVQIDFTWGDRLDRHHEERFFSVGLVFVSDTLFR